MPGLRVARLSAICNTVPDPRGPMNVPALPHAQASRYPAPSPYRGGWPRPGC
jgi:hypothetical protein